MLRHYFLTAMRMFARHRLYAFLNITGFAIGLACAILIALFVREELSYDTWLADTDHLYRLEATGIMPGREPMRSAQVPFPLLSAVREHIHGVQAVTHVMPQWMTFNIDNRQFRQAVTVVDPNFLQVIKLPLAAADPAHVLERPESVVLSQSIARKFFGDVNPIGRIVSVVLDRNGACDTADSACLSASYSLTVTGVLRDLPYNTQLLADIVIPNTSRADGMSPREKQQDWGAFNFDFGYVKLQQGIAPAAVLAELRPLLDRSFDPRAWGVNMKASEVQQYQLTPFREVHLASDQYGGMGGAPAGSWTAVYGLAAIAVLIVLIACFNFMNLATARATLRAREIALRKLGGATRAHLIIQFLGEAVLMALMSLLIAVALVEILLPIYRGVVDRPIEFHYLADWKLLAALVSGAMVVGAASGSYPALVLAGFRPASALKAGASVQSSGPGLLRAVLVVMQFAVSIGLGITALVVFSQIQFARQVDLGFHRDGIVVVNGIFRLTPSARDRLAHELTGNAQIVGVSYSNGVPFDLFNTSNPFIAVEGQTPSFSARLINTDPEFPKLYDMRLLAGRLLSMQRGTDISPAAPSRSLMINVSAARLLGFSPDEAIGKRINIGNYMAGQVVGVLSDTKLSGAHERIEPTLFYFDPVHPAMSKLSIRIRGNRPQEAVAFIDKTWKQLVPGTAIVRTFLTDEFDGLFRADVRQGELLGCFVTVAICIACLGLFGLAVFTAQRRTKEIGIRKISGARTADIVRRLLWQISIPVLLANLISWPVAYLYLTRWLETYAYRIALSPLYFISAAVVALVIAWATVFAHAIRLARASPILALRYE